MASDGETSCANDPNFAVIYSFLKVFGKLYGLQLPTITKLQEFIENTQEVSEPLKDLHLRLLRRAQKTLHSNRWEKGLIKFCHQQGHHQEAWEVERFSYKKASTQVKLKILKILLEYQFTCHPKFKSAVNALQCDDLRLDPIGRDKNGCVYWLQVDHEANLCLYKEDQDEETWQLVARCREELVKVIEQLKKGEEVCPLSTTTNTVEDSSGTENPQPETKSETKPEVDEDNEEEFLSPESESEQEEAETDRKEKLPDKDQQLETPVTVHTDNNEQKDGSQEETISQFKEDNQIDIVNTEENKEDSENRSIEKDDEQDAIKTVDNETSNSEDVKEENYIKEPVDIGNSDKNVETKEEDSRSTEETVNIEVANKPDEEKQKISEQVENTEEIVEEKTVDKPEEKTEDKHEEKPKRLPEEKPEKRTDETEEVGEAIEEPVMHVTGEGEGADCESYFIGEEVSEPVMYFYGEGWGYDNDTGNPDVIEATNETHSDEENDNEGLVNGEHESINNKTNLSKSVKLKTVNKRSLKKQPNESNDMKPDVKKPCVRDVDKCNSSLTDSDKKDTSTNDKSTTDNESPNKSNVKTNRNKVKKNVMSRKLKLNDGKEAINSVTETNNCQDKSSIIEKRKSSVSSVDHEEETTENDKEKSPEKDAKVEEPLPPKKLRLEATPESDTNATHSKDPLAENIDGGNKDNIDDSISKRKKIKASKGKFKRKNIFKNSNKTNDSDKVNDNNKKGCKSLKRSLVDATVSDKNKTESQSESEDDEPITSGKRLKTKPKKIITSSRKKVEAKHMEKHSSDESEEETLYSLAGKKSTKKLTKKKSKLKQKAKKSESKSGNESDLAPVRQSRRIAQQKIKEEAERRHQEEIALREMKMIHKKKSKDDEEEEEEWVLSGRSSSERGRRTTWRAADSSGPDPDSDSDSPLFELHHHEPDLEFGKSDHEFSPESDLESGEPAEPLKRARTLQEERDGGSCARCGSAEQPEWILLCDACDAGYHASCLKPMLFLVPQGDWFCPPCNHDKLIKSLESELVKYDELLAVVQEERARRKLEEPEVPEPSPQTQVKQESESDEDSESSGSWSGSSGGVYRLRARKHLPVSLRAQEYDRLISQAIKEEYVEPTTSAGNQGRGKDISTIIEAAEEEKMKAEREAIEQGKPVESKKLKKKQRRKPRKLNSLDVPSEDDDETDEDFKDTGGASSSEDISSSAERDTSNDSRSSDSLPIRRVGQRVDKKDRPKMRESSPEVKKKKKGVFNDSSSESNGAKEWSNKEKMKSRRKKRDKHKSGEKKRRRGLTQYDAEGNVVRPRVTYGGLSEGHSENDWSPKHRTRQKKINYTEMPNTDSEDEMHKSSGKHMPDSSDEFKISESDNTTDSDSDRAKRKREEESEEKMKALSDLVKKTAVVPLEKLPDDVTKAKTEELQAHLSNMKEASALNDVQSTRPLRGRGSRGGRGSRSGRGRGRGRGDSQTDDALAKFVGVKIKELGQDGSPTKSNQLEREKKRQEREAKQAEKEAKRLERMQKREEKEKMKEMKAKEREEKRQARLALQESKRIKKEKDFGGMGGMGGMGGGSMGGEIRPNMFPPEYRPAAPPRLQVRAELRGMMADERGPLGPQPHNALREGTLSVAGSPQPFRPVSEEPSIITRMPHMINQQYNRGPMLYGGGAVGAVGAAGGAQFQRGVFPARLPPAYYRLPHYPHHHDPHYRHMHAGGGGPSPPMQHGVAAGYPGYRPPPPHLTPDGRPPPPHPAAPPGKNPPHMQNLGQPLPPHPQNLHPPNMNPNLLPGHPQNMGPGRPGPPPGLGPGGPPNVNPQGLPPGVPQAPSPGAGGPSHPGPPSSQPIGEDMPIKIKAEVKTEPEYRSPPGSPCESAGAGAGLGAEPPRHPKIKVTERRPRFPLGPYAPHLHYPPYAAYPPPAQDAHAHNVQQYGAGDAGNSAGASPLRGYLPPGMRFPSGGPPGAMQNGAPPPRHPGLHQPFAARPPHLSAPRPPPPHPPPHSPHQPPSHSPHQPPSHSPHPGVSHSPHQPPSHSPHPGVSHSPHRPPLSPHHPGVAQPPPTQSPHYPGVVHPPPSRSPPHPAVTHGLPQGKSPPHPGSPPTGSPLHPGVLHGPPSHILQPPGVPPGPPSSQSPRLPGAPIGPASSRSPLHPGGSHRLPPSQSPLHPGGPHGPPESRSPHLPRATHGPPESQSPHLPRATYGPLPSQSPHHLGGPLGPPPSQSPHRPVPPGPSPSQSPHRPSGPHGLPPSQSPHSGGGHGSPPSRSPHNPPGGPPPPQPPHFPGMAPYGPAPLCPDRVKTEPVREEGSVFAGLVSYFSSQHEDDIDG